MDGSHAGRHCVASCWHAEGPDQAEERVVAVDQEHPGRSAAQYPERMRYTARLRQVSPGMGRRGVVAAAHRERSFEQV